MKRSINVYNYDTKVQRISFKGRLQVTTYPEGGSPAEGSDKGGVESAEVDEGVGSQVEVGDEGRNHVDLS